MKNPPYKICDRFLCLSKRNSDTCECGGKLHGICTDKGLELKLKKEAKRRSGFKKARQKIESGDIEGAISIR